MNDKNQQPSKKVKVTPPGPIKTSRCEICEGTGGSEEEYICSGCYGEGTRYDIAEIVDRLHRLEQSHAKLLNFILKHQPNGNSPTRVNQIEPITVSLS